MSFIDGRETDVGGIPVRRMLPRRARRMVGAWCFLDHIAPPAATGAQMSVGPHPHIGLQTVTWLLAGQVRHTDSLGNDVTIVPGELNLMTAGMGVAHAEEASAAAPPIHGVQLWIAQPTWTRNGEPDFAHHAALPTVHLDDLAATVLVGTFRGMTSPAVVETPMVGVELRGAWSGYLPLDPTFEYALCLLDGTARLNGATFPPGTLADLGSGSSRFHLVAAPTTRLLLLGGAPFGEKVVMWWNFVARRHDEIEAAWRDWTNHEERFGTVHSPLPRVEAAPPNWATTSHSDRAAARDRS